MDVGGWLRKLGLEQYEAAFRENRIDDTVLPRLTAEDLKELGVGFVGDRRKLLDAIATLHAEASAPTPAPSDAPPATDNIPKDTAERRQVTVMFSDLVGSTALSARLDPEDMREIIAAYQRAVAETVGRFGGFVAKYMGDGVLVYFGYPQAHEDDAERAVRAGLELVAAMGDLKTHAALQTRVGIATGLVVVGDLIGSGASQEQAIVGDTPNLAARLQGIAEPDSVVISESTRKLVGSLFELEDLGPQQPKGISGPARAWAALRPTSVEGRFEAMHSSGLTDLVGREEELDLLLRRWARAKTGEGQVALLSGEAGIGKSRLTAALLEHLAAEPHTRLRYFCSPQHTDSAFYPIIEHFERAAGFAHGDTAHTKLDKLDALLARIPTSRQDVALLAEMLSLPNDGRYPTLEPAPEQRRQKTLEVLETQLKILARSSPVLMVFEDAQWADPTSLEAIGRTVDRITNLRVLMIVTFRPEFEAPWVGQSYVTALAINRLGHRDVDTMIDRVVGSNLLPANVRKDIIERTDGIPLFVEEMTKAVLEAGTEPEALRTLAAVPSPVLAVPASLHASLMARLDRLGPAKEVAQIGAAIGREFSHALLAAVVSKPETELVSSLDRLIQAGLLFRRGVPPHATYLFKHALVQDAAYGTLLRKPRRALHSRIAETLERNFGDIAEGQPDLLARHYTEAGMIGDAAAMWGKAGLRSLGRSALVEALEQLTRALGQLTTLPSSPTLRREEIRLRVALIYPLMHVKGQAAPETKAAAEHARLLVEQAEGLGEPLDDPLLLFSALHALFVANITAFDGNVARERASQLLTLAQNKGAKVSLMLGHRAMGTCLTLMGSFVEAKVNQDRVMALYDPAEYRQIARRSGQDLRVITLVYRSMAQWALGYPKSALVGSEQALSAARDTGLAGILMQTMAITGLIRVISGDYATTKAQSDELIALAKEKGSSFWQAIGMLLQSALLALTGKNFDAVAISTSVFTTYRSTGSSIFLPIWLPHLARAYGELGQFDEAWSYIGRAIEAVETTQEKWCEADVYRFAGEIARMQPERHAAKAETYFERALAVARQQQAKSWELRAAMSMARLWRDQGKRNEARELLAPVYGWFTEGFDTRDLKEAKALLDELA
jgi:class 3 adenylate cyclase/predicted ATPase